MLEYLDENGFKNITQEEFDKLIDECNNSKKIYLWNYNLSNLKIKNKNLRFIRFYNCLLNNIVFEDCNLKYYIIEFSKIINTSFINCNFSEGNFYKCEFINTDLSTCNIKKCGFNFSTFDNITMPDYPMVCPEKGSFIGYKKVRDINDYRKKYILKLEISEKAKRSSAMGIYCRCDKAKVLEIQYLDGRIAKHIKKVSSIYDNDFTYELGKIVEEPNFDECRWHECAPGIHFLMDRKAAVSFG